MLEALDILVRTLFLGTGTVAALLLVLAAAFTVYLIVWLRAKTERDLLILSLLGEIRSLLDEIVWRVHGRGRFARSTSGPKEQPDDRRDRN